MDFKKFQQPDSILRPAPFWAINDRLDPQEVARQMADMIEVGLSGGFFHSRHGLITDYLSDEWFAAMDAALEVAKEKDGYVWLYDEDLWPSGNAGGQVAGMKDEYRATTLQAEFVPAGEEPLPDDGDEPKAAYALIGRQGASVEKIERIGFEEARSRKDAERILFRRRYSEKTPWWGGESYANLLHPEAMREFIRLTHETYKKKLGGEFGKRVPGIFTDEPQISQGPSALPWWDGIPDVYAKWYGRDFWADLPYLFFEGPEARKIRLIVHRTFLRQFCEAYSEPLFKWCEKNGLEHTGHYNAEENFEGQIRCHCGGIMAHYRYQQAPGIDHLCRQTESMLLVVKQVSSAARQLGRNRVLTEIFGVSRHTNTFEDFKWLGDYDLVLGATFFCPHLTLYSAKGRRKRDYPPNWNYQQTYWKELRPLNDYFTRVGYALTSGKAKPDVLFLHSIESGTAGHRFGFHPPGGVGKTVYQFSASGRKRTMPVDLPAEDLGKAHHYDQMLRRALDAALNAGYDCDLGDEGYIEDMGSVEGGLFRIGEMTYPVVVVPPSDTWRPRTFELLKKFVASGGKLILVGRLPKELDCRDAAEQWRSLASMPGVQTVPTSQRQIQDALDKVVPRTYAIRGADGHAVPKLYVHHRADGDQQMFFVVNSDRDRSHDYVFTVFGRPDVPVAVWNPLDATRAKPETQRAGKDLRFSFSLPPAGSLLIVTGADSGAPALPKPVSLRHVEIIPLTDSWQFARSEENILVMDRIAASLDGGKTWWDEDLEFRVRRRLASHFGTEDALMWQPWVAIRKGVFTGKGGPVVLRYKFGSAIERPRSAHLVIEDIDKGRVIVNGHVIDASNAGWQWDHSFGKVEITDLVQKGVNTVDFSFDYSFLSEVEQAYIVGDFGVRLANPYEGEIMDERTELRTGSWLDQGYPFYSGAMIYRTALSVPADGKRTFLRLVNPSGILYKARVNGRNAGKILWRPFELDLTPFLGSGDNDLEIEVIASRQNTFGPLHEVEGDDFLWCGPNAFEDDNVIREELSLFDYGLLGGAELVRV
ncbi:MAG TPA: hypothetical protein VMX94_07595 [Armatimonadota bacterium]|nr:hypothetical protein [Armatimonadota bacterium]